MAFFLLLSAVYADRVPTALQQAGRSDLMLIKNVSTTTQNRHESQGQDSVGNKGTVDFMGWMCVSFPKTYVGILTVNIMVLGDEGI